MKKIILTLFLMSIAISSAQNTGNEDAAILDKIYNTALVEGQSYAWLDHLSNQIGARLSGSLNAKRAIEWAEKELKALEVDKVWLQSVTVPKWTRGVTEFAYIETNPGATTNVPIAALGGSVATAMGGTKAQVVEVKSIEELRQLGKEAVQGKIVFYNQPMRADLINPFDAYAIAKPIRYSGAIAAAELGAVGVVIRSLHLGVDDYPHTGSMHYGTLSKDARIPAAAISTNGADLLSSMLALNPAIKFSMQMNCRSWKEVPSYNVIGELKGSEFPNEYIVIAAHLDSWDLGDGARVNGAGVVQAMEVLRLLKKIGYTPKRSIRVALLMNNEDAQIGSKQYAAKAKAKQEQHIFALESSAAGFMPTGFSLDTDAIHAEKIADWKTLFKPYWVHSFTQGSRGTAISALKNDKIVLAELRADSQRYFEYHHSKNDTFSTLNQRELTLGAAAMTSFIYLVDKHGL